MAVCIKDSINSFEHHDLVAEECLQNTDLSYNKHDRRNRYDSDGSSITNNQTSNEYSFSSETSSHTSNQILSLSAQSTINVSSKEHSISPATVSDANNQKSKKGLRKFLQKIFGPSLHHHETKSFSTDSPSHSSKVDLLPITRGPMRLFVIRHGERLDRYYSAQWLRQAFDKDENYCRFSPILPETLPLRTSIHDYDLDPPLTCAGLKDAYQTGSVLKRKDFAIQYCYSSPALRCIQTAAQILEGLQLQNKIKIRIEPGLFECTAWYVEDGTNNVLTMPNFMTKAELLENKFPIDKHYSERMTVADLSRMESELEYYERSHLVTATILNSHENEVISQIQRGQLTLQDQMHVLFVAHAPSLETCTRRLCGGQFRPSALGQVIRNVDYLTMIVIEKTDNNCIQWKFRRNSFYDDEF